MADSFFGYSWAMLVYNHGRQIFYILLMNSAQILQQFLPQLLSYSPQYTSKVEDLFKAKHQKAISLKHFQRNIVINPKMIFNLLESQFLIRKKQENILLYYQLKRQILSYIKHLIEDFPLNAKFICEEAFLIIENNKKMDFIVYLIKDSKNAYLTTIAQDNKDLVAAIQTFSKQLTSIIYAICNVSTFSTSQLKFITQNLTDLYYQQKLSTQFIADSFRLLDAGLQQRNITPYLYFIDNNKNDSVRILFTNNKWPFAKGMTIFLWIKALKQADSRLLWLKTQDNNELILCIKQGTLYIESINKEKKSEDLIEICSISLNSITMIGIQLQPFNEGLFKSTSYNLNININGTLYTNITSKIPKFQSNEFLTEFSLLNGFIGNLYGIIITTRTQLNKYEQIQKMNQYGICRQHLVWQLIRLQILKTQSIICIFNAQRNFQGLLLNYVSERNHACYEGRCSEVKYHKYDSKIIEIYLPFLYFLTLIPQKHTQWLQLFDLILKHILQIIAKEHYETPAVLFILYFLEINEYKISQSTLNYLYQCRRQSDNFYLNIAVKYMDHHLLIEKGLVVDESIELFEDPVEKIIFIFYLQSLWYQKWNIYQGFQGWWSPPFFSPQNDLPYNAKDFEYSGKKTGHVQWSVMNIVTRDYCKCFLQPVFIIPTYGKISRFQQQYMRKQCFNESFKLNLSKKPKGQVFICKKTSSSKFDKLTSKIFSNIDQRLESPKKKPSQVQIKQLITECYLIDILTIVQGTITINRDGFITFASCHREKRFDHMCVKAFNNQQFYYISIPFQDIRKIYKKRFNASANAVYIKTREGKEVMFNFYLNNADSFIDIMEKYVKVQKDSYQNYLNSHEPFQWIDKEMSNYEYLQWLNQVAGRNYNDTAQYPVLPWFYIKNEENSKEEYRDLTKNMGSHGDEQRINKFLQKYHTDNEEQLFSQYHFGTHYSSSAIIFNYLIRIRPYSIGALTLQSGKFDCADRIFYSYYGSWINATSSPTDIRQLIPELYNLPEMFINKNNYFYGLTQQKIGVDNVIIPIWAKDNPYYFVAQLRKSIQSQHVSEKINNWIDLIYGYKQRGKDAVQHMNIFYPLTYQNCIDLNKVSDPDQRISFQTQIAHFGQNPAQVIGNNPHPIRKPLKANWQQKLIADGGQLLIQKCFLNKSSTDHQTSLFKSIFQQKNAVLGIRFVNNQHFFVLRKHEYYLFKILNKKTDFLSKEIQATYSLQSCAVGLHYKELSTFIPITNINDEIMIVAGFYNGNSHIIFLNEPKYNMTFKFATSTITAIHYYPKYKYLFIGDKEGYLKTYRVTIHQKQLQFQQIHHIKAHDSKINDISMNAKANLLCTCSEDGSLNLYNLYSLNITMTIKHPSNSPIHFAHISTTPLYCLAFYSKENSTVYIYSINGQYLDSIIQKTGFIYNMAILKATDSTQSLIYLNSQRQMFIWQLPFLRLKRKLKVKKDEHRISCFQTCQNGKMGIIGTQDGALQIIANPLSY